MSKIFNSPSVKKYELNWKVVDGPHPLDAEDFATFEPEAELVKSTHGKSFCFIAKASLGAYKVFIPADKEVTLPIGTRVPLKLMSWVTLRKEGEKDIDRIRVDEANVGLI